MSIDVVVSRIWIDNTLRIHPLKAMTIHFSNEIVSFLSEFCWLHLTGGLHPKGLKKFLGVLLVLELNVECPTIVYTLSSFLDNMMHN